MAPEADNTGGGEGDALLSLLYGELRRLAASKMALENPAHTLQPTALVHEAWLRMDRQQQSEFASRTAYFRAAAETMRRVLIDRARASRARKRGGDRKRVPEEALAGGEFAPLQVNAPDDELLAVHEALEQLAAQDPDSAELVKLRYFVGMTMQEAADVLEMPLRSAERRWTFCRAWLRTAIGESTRCE